MVVAGREHSVPELESPALDEVASLVLEHRVVVRNRDKLFIAEAFGVGDVGEEGIALLAVLADDERVVDLRGETSTLYSTESARLARCSP